ncbi:MAG: gliding motility-associated C-terminal domain-containing protein, partial [Cytophagaceae bacterium]
KIPNLITPNADSKNETLFITQDSNIKITIYNIWGEKIFQSDNYLNVWKTNVEGIYYVFVKACCDKEYKGWFEVLK